MGLYAKSIVIHVSNLFVGSLFYFIMKPLLVQEGDPEPNKGLLNTQEPSYTFPLQFAFIKEYLRLSVVPSFFYALLHITFYLLGAEETFYMAFAQESDAWTQIAFTCLIMAHCGIRQLAFFLRRNEHRAKVVDTMALRGNETVLDVKCGKGYWSIGVAQKLNAGGRILCMDTWDTPGTPYDGQWAVENSRREEVSGRVEIMNYGDPHFLVYKDEVFDIAMCTWLETEDEINFYNLISECVRVTRPGGRLLFVMPYHPTSLLKKNMQDLGLKDITVTLVTTTYLMNQLYSAIKPDEMDTTPPRIDRSENAVTDESPGFDGNSMLYCLLALGFYLNGCYTIIVKWTWSTWMVPSGMSPGDTVAYGFMAENTVWLCWAVVDMHMILGSRPVYMIKRIGIVNLWMMYFVQFFLMVLIFNVATWLPLLALAAATGFSHVALRAIFRVLARPAIGSTLDSFFAYTRQNAFLSMWKDDYGDKRNRYRKARKNKRTSKRRETDMLLDDIDGPEPEDSYAPGL